ncbi:translocation/assembly module TamB domain-containing protein [Ottowia sp.]|uniref:translocation/assembly module TamB domain-containing protein n=1 Tax=Ottowia sp. TaxID=1898956 RepID=UPI003A877368
MTTSPTPTNPTTAQVEARHATDSVATSAATTSADGQLDSKNSPHPVPHHAWRRTRRILRLMWRSVGALVLLVALVTGGLWAWLSSEGSLATVLGWASARLPLVVGDVQGSVLRGGRIGRLQWSQNGLSVNAEGAVLLWSPQALYARTLQIDQLSAARIAIEDKRPPQPKDPHAGPPTSLALPLLIDVRQLAVDDLHWAGPPALSLHGVRGHYRFDGGAHQVALEQLQFQSGRYRATARLTAQAPVQLQAALSGALSTAVPEGEAALALRVQAAIQGPLTDMKAWAKAQGVPPAESGDWTAPANTASDASGFSAPPLTALPSLPASTDIAPTIDEAAAPDASGHTPDNLPQTLLQARITPWAAQPLPEASARLHALDLGALWPQAPRTQLAGTLDVTPLPATEAAGWAVRTDLRNASAGPWDKKHLPLDRVRADVQWQGGVATVRELKVELAGGQLTSHGRWAAPAPAPAESPSTAANTSADPAQDDATTSTNTPAAPTAQDWQITTELSRIDPARLYSTLAALPISGRAQVTGQGSAIAFDAALQAQRGVEAPSSAAARPLDQDLRALRLRDMAAQGQWDAGVLTLQQLRVRTDDAELAGSVRVRPATPDAQVDLKLTAPGTLLSIKGDAQPRSGGGTLQAQLSDAARALGWLQSLPVLDKALTGMRASGSATLNSSWRGGWQDPTVQAQWSAPTLQWQASADATPITVRDTTLNASGQLSQAQFRLQGDVQQGERQLKLNAALSGGRTSSAKTPLAQASWRASLSELRASVQDPALGAGTWQTTVRQPVAISYNPAKNGQLQSGLLEVGASELALTSPAPTAQALLAWGPQRWQNGRLSSQGRLQGLPLEWAERLSGQKLSQAGVSGSMVFNGQWQAEVGNGQGLRLNATLERASGDLTVRRVDNQTNVTTTVDAGVRDVRATLRAEGKAVQLALLWDTERAGRIDANVRTELAASTPPGGGGATAWSWPESAPLQGQVKFALPQIAAWSVLAPPGWRIRGALAGDVQVSNTRTAPQIKGSITADDLALRSLVDGVQLGEGRLRARLDGTRLMVDEFTLRGEGGGDTGGRLSAKGEAGWINGQTQARLQLTLDKLRASIRTDRQLTLSGQVQAGFDGHTVSADGRLNVDQALIVLPSDMAPSLGSDVVVHRTDATSKAHAAEASKPPDSPLQARLGVRIDLGEHFQLKGQGVDTRLAGDLTFSADGPLSTPPRLTGTIRTVGGTFRAYGKSLVIQRGRVIFKGDIGNPSLDILALRPIYSSDQKVGAQVLGTALLPRVNLYSEPGLPESQTLAWLLLGREAPSSGAEAAMLQSAAVAALGGRESQGLGSRMGLDELGFNSTEDNGETGTSLSLGKRISDRMYAAYEHSLAGTTGSLMIYYELSRRWTLRGQAGENSAVDLIYKLSFN